MKKEKFSKKLNFKKEVLSNLSKRQIVGGDGLPTIDPCDTTILTTQDPGPTWECTIYLTDCEC